MPSGVHESLRAYDDYFVPVSYLQMRTYVIQLN